MRADLFKKNGTFHWLFDGVIISPDEGHMSIQEAKDWFMRSSYYKELKSNYDNENRRTRPMDLDRRTGRDRRERYSTFERRIFHGRRWLDKLNKHFH